MTSADCTSFLCIGLHMCRSVFAYVVLNPSILSKLDLANDHVCVPISTVEGQLC